MNSDKVTKIINDTFDYLESLNKEEFNEVLDNQEDDWLERHLIKANE